MTISERKGTTVAEVADEEFRNPYLLEDAFESLIAGLGGGELVLDVRGVKKLAGPGLEVLVAAHGIALIHKTRLVLAGIGEGARRVFAPSGDEDVFAVCGSVEEALALLRGNR